MKRGWARWGYRAILGGSAVVLFGGLMGGATHGVRNDGEPSDGVARDGLAHDGAAHDRAARDPLARDRLARDGLTHDRVAHNGEPRDGVPADRDGAATSLPAPISVDSVPFDLVSNRPVLEVLVNGDGPFRFALDMGATGLGRIEKSLARSMDLPISGVTSNFDGVSTSTEQLVRVERLSAGLVEHTDVELMTRDRYAHQGLLARGFFAGRLLTIDYPGQRLLLRAGTLDRTDPSVVAYTAPFHLPGTVGSIEATFYLDTGSNMSVLFPTAFLEDHDVAFEETGRVFTARRANTQHDVIEARLRVPITVGSVTLHDALVYHSDITGQINLGGEVLRDYLVTFDQRHRLVAIRPPGPIGR